MNDYKTQLDTAYSEYSDKVSKLAEQAYKELSLILKKHNMTLVCGMGTWVISAKNGKIVYIEDIENPPKYLLTITTILDISVEGMRDHCFGSIM